MAVHKMKVQIGKRGLKKLADDAIKHDFMKGIIEIVTNADDSYCRLEEKGQVVSGRIDIGIKRHPRKKVTLLEVRDRAEGMDKLAMMQGIGIYGEDTSGGCGRGIFGMGLKDTINAFGNGFIASIKEGKLYLGELDLDNFNLHDPVMVDAEARKRLGIAGNGTLVSITIMNPKVRIPQYETFRQNIQTHVCLRLIVTDPKRDVVLTDFGTGSAESLTYKYSENEVCLDRDVTIDGYPRVDAHLCVKKALGTEPLTQQGSYRTGGILVISKRTVHQATLFGFDEDPYASKLFGEVKCDYIDVLQGEKQEAVVKRDRTGLEMSHPFSKALFDVCRKELELIVRKEKEEAEERRRRLETEETLKRFRNAVKDLNNIASKELEGIGGPGKGKGHQEPPQARIPINGFEFIPDEYHIVIAEKEKLKLKVIPDQIVKEGDLIEISTELTGIKLLTNNLVVPKTKKIGEIVVVEVLVEGIQPGAEGFVSAICNGKKALALVKIVSEKTTRPPKSDGGFFKEIKYEEQNMPLRARFERSSGIIWINTKAPSIGLYFGPTGEGQEQPQNMAFVAELVTELAIREIGREKRRKALLDIPSGIDEMDALFNEIDRLKNTYAAPIHKALVDRKYLR